MALTFKAAAAFRWFGTHYDAGDTVDTTGYDTTGVLRLLRKAPVYVDAGGGLSTGTTIGVDTLVDPNTVRVAFVSPWGIDGDGNPYYVDGGFAVDGEAAILCVNPTTGNFAVVRPDGAVAV